MLRVVKLTYSVGDRTLLADLDLTAERGQSVSVQGRSGSGKSTLLSCILGLLKADSGEIWLEDELLSSRSSSALARARREQIGMVFQDGELLPELTAQENVALPALMAGVSGELAEKRAVDLLANFHVQAGQTPAGLLSGGERQRTAVARAVINEPGLVLADEPTGSLDEDNRDNLADILFDLPKKTGCALVVVTHDEAVAARADRRYLLSNGQLSPQEL